MLICVLAFALRAYRLDAQSLWYDEGLSVHLASLPLSETIAQSAVTDHPPLHAVLLNLWMRVAGSSEFSIRFVSVFFGTLAAALACALGRRLGGNRIGAIAAGLIAIAPMAVWYSQEARGYSLLITLILIAVLAFLRLVMGDWHRRVWLVYILSSAAAMYTHYFAAFAIAALNVAYVVGRYGLTPPAPLSRSGKAKATSGEGGVGSPSPDDAVAVRRQERGSGGEVLSWLLAQLAIALLFLPWLPNALAQAASNATYFPGRVTWDTVVTETWRAFAAGDFSQVGQPALPSPISALWLAIVLLGVVSPIVNRRLSSTPTRSVPHSQSTRNLLLLVTLLTVPLLLMSILAWAKPKFAPRYLLPSLPAFVTLASFGIDALLRLRNRLLARLARLPLLVMAAGYLLVTAQIYFDPLAARPAVRAVAAYVEANEQPGDVVLLVGGHQAPVFEYYYDGAADVVSLPPDLLPAAQAPLDARVMSQLAQVAATHSRAWLVLWQQHIADPTGMVLGELGVQARRLEVGQNFHEMSLLLFDLRNAVFRTGPQHELEAAFTDPIRLVGFDLDSYQFIPGQGFSLALYFESKGSMARNYQVFTHLLGPDGSMAAQADGIAGADSYPTSLWAIDTLMRNTFGMRLPSDLPAGTYRLVAGLYDASGRLALSAGGDAVEIATITVQP